MANMKGLVEEIPLKGIKPASNSKDGQLCDPAKCSAPPTCRAAANAGSIRAPFPHGPDPHHWTLQTVFSTRRPNPTGRPRSAPSTPVIPT